MSRPTRRVAPRNETVARRRLGRRGTAALAAALGGLAVSATARAAPPPVEGPPEPNYGERLDGREAPVEEERYALAAPRVVLAVPKYVLRGVMYPVIELVGATEQYGLYHRVYWTLTSEDERVGLRPEAIYHGNFGIELGLRYFDTRTFGDGSLLELRARAGTQGQVLGQLRLRPGGSPIELEARYQLTPNAIFAGTHGESPEELEEEGRARSRYEVERGLVRLRARETIYGPLSLRLRTDLDMRSYEAGEGASGDPSIAEEFCRDPVGGPCYAVDTDLVPGFYEGLRVVRGGAGFTLDARSEERHGTGVLAAVDVLYAHGFNGDPSSYLTVSGDARFYLGFRDRQLMLRVRSGGVEPLGDAPVPFEELLSPTEDTGVRALSEGELRGHTELVGTAEYRFLLSRTLDGSFFVDYGGAFDRNFDGFSFDRMVPGIGFGLGLLPSTPAYWKARPIAGIRIAWAPSYGALVSLGVGL